MKKIYKWINLTVWIMNLFAFGSSSVHAQEKKNHDTLLMFVGEPIEVLSIASRREESAGKAPAIAHVISRNEFQTIGADTVSQVLTFVPGFHMAKKEFGYRPYLRGIPDSFLFLYDTVPLGSDVSKSYHPIDEELSLASIKRIEIIRGPGSVLWGPDAFAGIVNVAPMTGKDLDGIESGAQYKSHKNDIFAYANVGHDGGAWDIFMSISARTAKDDDSKCRVISFWNDNISPTPPELRFGETFPGKSEYGEVSARLAYGNIISLTGRITDSKKSYTISDALGDLTWKERRHISSRLIKLEGKKDLSLNSAVRFIGVYYFLLPEYDIIDLSVDQKEISSYGEMIYDHSFFLGQGLLTTGISYRKKQIENAPIWDSYLPEYLGEDNLYFLPTLSRSNYDTTLVSVFGQYNHKIGNTNLWFGIRNDEHDEYQDHVSINAGVAWSKSQEWLIKLTGGTAYRTPFARQLLENEKPELEKIECVNLQIKWRPVQVFTAGIVGFLSRIDNHIIEDPYAGLSEPNTQDFSGIELEFVYSPTPSLSLSANLTKMIDNGGNDERYRYNDYTYIKPDGSTIKHYVDINYPYDGGPDTMFHLMASWKPIEKCNIHIGVHHIGSSMLVYPRGENFITTPSYWLMDATASINDFVIPGLDIDVSVKNVADHRFETPGTYHPIKGDPAEIILMFRKKW